MKIIPFQEFVQRYYSGAEFIVIDTETNGLNTFHDDLVEIAATIWSKNGKKDSFEELMYIHPNKINQEAWNVHKIPLEKIENARQPADVLEDFINFCGDRPMIAHNIKFDRPMLDANLIRHGLRPYQNDDVACTLVYSKEQSLPGKLSELARHYQIKPKEQALHRALYDVEVLIEVLEAMMKKNEPEEMQYSLIF